ncbi:hypothetical protein MKY98_25405 [Paenibacillus sp. FSL M8-0228]|jgi:hypothetical protein|uniref:hypothetical protein n=1 Tax=Paenibacillus TaxID=44249 RepID=UPI000494E276|nr:MULTISPECIES: hypothetical protein [Paenibacillus]MBO3284986.1 hypothetical protein [Paenibacillus polymyxa]MBP1307724.1 hypothetical protein [Paenibacillus sp. 1182]ODB53603.1 hypothetical protein A7311_04470 [Paenibacillus polymyxa]UMY54695.1 hypothetical protein MLD56_24725 [Paenibacillus peoriae]
MNEKKTTQTNASQQEQVQIQAEIGCYQLPKCCGFGPDCPATYRGVFKNNPVFYSCGCSP